MLCSTEISKFLVAIDRVSLRIVSLTWVLLCNSRFIQCWDMRRVVVKYNIWLQLIFEVIVFHTYIWQCTVSVLIRCPDVSEWTEVTPTMKNQFYVTVGKYNALIQRLRAGVPKLFLTMYHLSILTDERVPLIFLIIKRMNKITKIHLIRTSEF